MSNYRYKKIIKKPKDLGVGNGDYKKDFDAMKAYLNLLVDDISGGGIASNLNEDQTPGDSFFLPSTLTCEKPGGGEVSRWFFVDNTTSTNNLFGGTAESVEQLVMELPKMFTSFTEIGPQKCELTKKTIVSQAPNGSNIESEKKNI